MLSSIVILCIGIGVGYILFGNRSQSGEITKKENNTVVAVSPSISSVENKQKVYTDTYNILSFPIPTGWEVSSEIVMKDFYANQKDVPVEAIKIKKNVWTLQLDVQKHFTPGECGGLQGYTREAYDETVASMEKFTFLGKKAYRFSLENGKYWAGGDAIPPYPQPIFFESSKPPVQVTDEKSTLYGQHLYELAFCYENEKFPIAVDIHYESPRFTEELIKNNVLDYATVEEMDKILASFTFAQ
jgi:hypothetical protein